MTNAQGLKISALFVPHLGRSLKDEIKEMDKSGRSKREKYQVLQVLRIKRLVYQAFILALNLLGEGYFFSDPNFGNIILFDSDNKTVPVLIDFTNARILTPYKFLSNTKINQLKRKFIRASLNYGRGIYTKY